MKYFLLLLILPLVACNYELVKKEDLEPVLYEEQEVLVHHGGAFNACPPLHRKQGRC